MAKHPKRAAQELAELLDQTPYDRQPDVFYEALKETHITRLPAKLARRPKALFEQSFESLRILSRANLPLTLGMGMHQYLMSSLLSAHTPESMALTRNREHLLQLVAEGNLIIVSSYGDRVQGAGKKRHEVSVRREGDGWLASGRKVFNSGASRGDWVAFTAEDENGVLLFFLSPLKSCDRISIGGKVFAGAMDHTDTRNLDYDQVEVREPWVLADNHEDTFMLLHFSTAWFEALASGAYLGAADRALAEARKFALEVVTSHGCHLAEMDGIQADLGRLSLIVKGAELRAQRFGEWVADLPRNDFERVGVRLLEEASAIKYSCCQAVEAVVAGVRAVVGTRSLAGGSILARILEQHQYGQLHPLMAGVVERDLGNKVLGQDVFLGIDDFALIS